MQDRLDEYFKEILQREVKFILNEKKVLRKGRLILYAVKDYYITFIISTTKCPRKVYEIYYPFDVINDVNNNQIIFDYSIDTLTNDSMEYSDTIKKVSKKMNPHIFFNSQLRIEYE